MNASEVAKIRSQLGLSQAQLGELLGVHTLTVSRWERGLLQPTAHQVTLLESFGAARKANKKVGDEARDALIAVGVVAALLILFSAAAGDTK